MTPRALVLCYSQTGQTKAASAALAAPLQASGWQVDWRQLEVDAEYPFPWPLRRFLGVFPETVLGIPPPLRPLEIDDGDPPDLIVLASSVWYLMPCLPVQAFLGSPQRSLLADRPVIAVVTCRNMWYSAVAELQARIQQAGARLLGAVVLEDKSPRWATFVMTPRLFLTGKSDSLWGFLPAPGIEAGELARASRVGEQLAERGLVPIDGDPAPPEREAAEIDPENLVLDLFASRAFRGFARPILALGRFGGRARAAGLYAFAACLALGVVVALPVLAVGRVLMGKRMREAASRYRLQLEDRVAYR